MNVNANITSTYGVPTTVPSAVSIEYRLVRGDTYRWVIQQGTHYDKYGSEWKRIGNGHVFRFRAEMELKRLVSRESPDKALYFVVEEGKIRRKKREDWALEAFTNK